MKKPLLHLAQRVFNTPLLISKRKLDSIMAAIGPRLGADLGEFGIEVDGVEVPVRPKASYAGAEWSDDGNYAVTPNGTAIIPVHGTLVRRADWMDAASGLRSYESIRADLSAAMGDKYVSRVLLDVDSGGGEANDCFDLADLIYSMRSVKPMYAFANDYAFSAAYAIASAAQQVAVTRVGGVGSIGVICVHCDQSEFDAKIGVKYTAIYAGEHKNDFSAHEPLGKDVKADAQREIDRLYQMFVDQVARNRGMAAKDVIGTQAGLFYGDEGVAAGLADQVSTFDEFLASIDRPVAGLSQGAMRLAASAVIPAAEVPTIDAMLERQAVAAIGEPMKIDPQAATADEEMKSADDKMPEECKQDPEPDPEDPDEDEEDEEEKPMETKTEVTPAAAPVIAKKPNAAAQIARMCNLAGRTDLLSDFLDRELTTEQALEELDAARIAAQPKISSARRPTGNSNAMAEIESQARARAGAGGVTKAKAFKDALFANPDAYTEYLRENPQLDGGKTKARFEALGQ